MFGRCSTMISSSRKQQLLSHNRLSSDFKQGWTLQHCRKSRKLNEENARSERQKQRVAAYRRRPAPPADVPKPQEELTTREIVTRDAITNRLPSAYDINQTLIAFENDPANFDMQTLVAHLQAAEFLTNGSQEDQISLKGHGFLFRIKTVGPLLSTRHDGTEAIRHALCALRKITSKENAQCESFMIWLLTMLCASDFKIVEHAAIIIGTLSIRNTPLAIKLLQTQGLVDVLVHILENPADKVTKIYQTNLAQAVARLIKVLIIAANESEIVSSPIRILTLTSMGHLENLWLMKDAHEQQKHTVHKFVCLLAAAFQSGNETTKFLANAIEDFGVLGNILNTEGYSFEICGTAMLLPTLQIIANVTSLEGEVYVDRILDCGFLEFCVTFLNADKPQKSKLASYRELERQLFLCMANIAAGTPHQVQKLLDAGETIRGDLIKHAAYTSRRHSSSFETALWVIVNCFTQGADDEVVTLVKCGALIPILNYIVEGAGSRMYHDKQLAIVALQALDCTLKLFHRLKGPGIMRIHDKELMDQLEWIMEFQYNDDDQLLPGAAERVCGLLKHLHNEPVQRAEKIVKRLF